MLSKKLVLAVLLMTAVSVLQPTRSFSQELPYYLRDRGRGIPVSQFGTYVRKGEFLVYPFFEYYHDNNLEYEPADFGHGSIQEFRGRYRANEGIFFISYGVSNRLVIEFEAGVISAELNKSQMDLTTLPAEIEESGLSDVEGQIRWRWNFESSRTPELFSYFETVFPTGEKNSLIGTSVWEFKMGSGLVKGFRWGTVTFRFAFEYASDTKKLEAGEYAVEYLKKVSDRFRFFAMLEGSQDEASLIPEIQWHFSHFMFLKANSGFGVTSKATDIAPEVGIMFHFDK